MTEQIDIRTESFTVKESKEDNEVTIEGTAVPYDTESRNGVSYTKDSIKKKADSLEGKPFLFNHDPNIVLGKVVSAKPGKNSLKFEAVADISKEKVKDIKNGYVNTVSIQAIVEENEKEDSTVDVREFLELSSAPIPGFPSAQAQANSVRVETFPTTEQDGNWRINENLDYDVAVKTNWDGVDQSEFPDKQAYRMAHILLKEDDEALPIVHYEDEEMKLVYEALNSAYDSTGRVDGLSKKMQEDVRSMLEELRKEEFPDSPRLDADSSESKESYDDYPKAATENAKMALEAKEDTGDPNDCGTRTGWARANQLANREPISKETIARMASFARHEDNKDQGEEGRADCGWMMWKAWGGDEGIEWAERKLDELEESAEEILKKEPFAGYKDFEDCVKQNSDKKDPEAYCAVIKKSVEEGKCKYEGDTMTKDKKTEQDIEDLTDAMDWLEQNAPDEVVDMIVDAVRGDEKNESEEEKEDEDNKEERLSKLEEKLSKIEKNIESEEVEGSKQPGVGDSDEKLTQEKVASKIKEI